MLTDGLPPANDTVSTPLATRAGSRSMRIFEPHFDVATFWTGAGKGRAVPRFQRIDKKGAG